MNLIRGTAGSVNADAFARGWAVGHMHPPGIAHAETHEIKLWHYPRPIHYGKKMFGGTEFIVCYGGIIRLHLHKEDEHGIVELDGSCCDWVIIGPGYEKVTEVVKGPAFGVCVRWPSGPGVNQVLEKGSE